MLRYDEKTFFAYARKAPFGGFLVQDQVDGCKAIIAAWPEDTDLRWIAYSLATAYHETAATMKPIAEYGKGKGRPYGKKGKYGQAQYGRGYVQLTWDDNYEKADKDLGLNGRLLKNFDLALQHDIAARIMVSGMTKGWFTGKRLSTYFGKVDNPIGARFIINGKRKKTDKYADKAELIATYYEQFLGALTAAVKVETGRKQRPAEATKRAAEADEVPTAKSGSIWTVAGSVIGGGGLTAFGGIDNPYALGGIALLVVAVGVGAWLVLSGRVSINRLIPEELK